FLNRVGIGDGDATSKLGAALQIVDSYSIHLKIVVEDRSAIRNESRAGGAAESRAQKAPIRYLRGHPWIQSDDLRVVARTPRECPFLFAIRPSPQSTRFFL